MRVRADYVARTCTPRALARVRLVVTNGLRRRPFARRMAPPSGNYVHVTACVCVQSLTAAPPVHFHRCLEDHALLPHSAAPPPPLLSAPHATPTPYSGVDLPVCDRFGLVVCESGLLRF